MALPVAVGIVVLVVVVIGGLLMAKLADVQSALSDLNGSVQALAARIPAPSEPPAATEADLDGLVQAIGGIKSTVDGLAQAPSA